MRNWIAESEARRRDAAFAGLGAAAIFALLFLARGSGSSSDLTTLALVVVVCFTASVLLVGVFVRVRTVNGVPAFLTLVPGSALGGIGSGRSDRTYPMRLSVQPTGLTLTSGAACVCSWSFDQIREVQIRRVVSPRPLGYVTIQTNDGHEMTGRIFQPRLLAKTLPGGSVRVR